MVHFRIYCSNWVEVVLTIFHNNVDNLARSKSLLPAAGHSLPLVVQQLDGVVHQLRGLQGEVGLSIKVNNTMKYDNMTIIVV